MKIGIAGPFNPKCVEAYFDEAIDLPNINITASSVNTYVNGLLELGHEVIVFTTNSTAQTTKVFSGNHITIYAINNKFIVRGFARYRMHKRIRKAIQREIDKIDILHAEWTYEYAYAMLPFVKEKKVYCSVRDWCPYLLSIAKDKKEKYYWRMSLFMFKRVMQERNIHFIANSNYTKEKIIGDYPNNTVTIIPNPIQRSFIIEERTNYPESPVFVSISQSIQNIRKNYITLLKAFQLYLKQRPDAKLILIGWYSEEWFQKVQDEGLLKNVELKGSMNHDDIFEVLDNSSCMIHPSLEETFGNILLEAMCRRIPCIGGEASGAVPQVLGFGKYGFLCDITKPESILDAMNKLDNKTRVKEIIEGSTQHIKDTYADNVVAELHIKLFEGLL
jgi:glycosyltransferase involved in cell wall biosynthesis